MKISCSSWNRKLRRLCPANTSQFFSATAIRNQRANALRSKQVQKVVSKINSSNVDFVFVSVKTFSIRAFWHKSLGREVLNVFLSHLPSSLFRKR